MVQIQKGLGPVARALVAGTVTAITPPASRGRGKRFWTVALDTPEGALAVLVPTDHKIYSRVASRAWPGHFWIVEAGLSAFHDHVEIHARHVLSDKDTFQPRAGDQESAGVKEGERPAATPRRRKAVAAPGQLPLAL